MASTSAASGGNGGREKGGKGGKGRGRIIICGNCHKSGHYSYDCPERGDAEPAKPPSPCTWCGGDHWSYSCDTAAKRRSQGVCLKCGDPNHWLRACPHHTAETQAATLNVWCLRCGNTDHSTSRCPTTSAPVHNPSESDDIRVCTWCGVLGHDISDCFRRVPSQVKEYDAKFATLDDRITEELAPIKKALAQYDTLSSDVKQLTTRVDHLYTWKASTDTTLKSVQAKETEFDKLLDGLPTWKRQVDASLHNGQARFDDFLSKHWQPVKKKFDQMLEEWQACGREKRTRVVAEISDDDDERDLYDPANDDKAVPMAERDGAPAPSRSPKRPKGQQPWLKIKPLTSDDPQWTEQLLDVLLQEWQERYTTRLRAWLQVHSTDEMVATVESISGCENTRARNSCIRSVLKSAQVHPHIFSDQDRGGQSR